MSVGGRKGTAERIERMPAGRPTALANEDIPLADGLVYVSPHLGQGELLMSLFDPSVIDEADPMSIDPELDPFSAANGFQRLPGRCRKYRADFVETYRRAQRARVERIDGLAHDAVTRRRAATKTLKDGGPQHGAGGSRSGTRWRASSMSSSCAELRRTGPMTCWCARTRWLRPMSKRP
jgi:hypothetical protein